MAPRMLERLEVRNKTFIAATVILAGAAITVLGAWVLQFTLDLTPCPLCLEQRLAYYGSIPFAGIAILAVRHNVSSRMLFLIFLGIAVAMLWNAGLGIYHAGIEWRWWAGPEECSGTPDFSNIANVNVGPTERIKSCKEAQLRLFGISLAGYNAMISLGLAAISSWGATSAIKKS